MTTLTTIINNAFRESGITAVGTLPDANESAEALTILVNFINSLYFEEIGEHLTDYNVGTNGITYGPDNNQTITTVIKPNSRLICNLTGSTTLYLPAVPHDGSLLAVVDASGNFGTNPLTLNGNGRLIISGTSLVLNTNNYNNLFLYDAVFSNWTLVPTVASGSDQSPIFATRWDDLLVIGLAMRLAPRYGAEIRPETIQAYERLLKQFKSRYSHGEEVSSEQGLTYLPSNPWSRFFGLPNFSRGN